MNPASVLACVALLAGPGLGGSLVLYRPGEIGLPTRLALSFAMGCVIPALLALALALLGLLSPIVFFVLLLGATAALWVVGVAGGRGREHLSALKRELRLDLWPLVVGLLVVAGIAILRLTVSPLLPFSTSSSWRYWADGVELADAGRIPRLVLQYGVLLQPAVNKALSGAFGAGLTFAVGREPLPGMAALLWFSSLGLSVALWCWGNELGLRFMAPLFPVLAVTNRLFLNGEMTIDLNNFKAEILGRLVAFVGLAFAFRALRDRRWKDGWVAGGLLGAAIGFHVVPALIALSFLAFYALARLLIDRDVVDIGVRSAGVLVAAALVGAIVLFVPRGDAAIGGAGTDERSMSFDSTRYLNAGKVVPLDSAKSWYIPPQRALKIFTASATGFAGKSRLGRWFPIALVLLGLAVAIVMLVKFPAPLRPIGVMTLGASAVIVGLIWFFSFRYRLYVPAYFGVRRLLDYSSIPLILAALALAEGGLLLFVRRVARGAALAAALVIATAAWLILTAAPPGAQTAKNRPMLDAFTWIRTRLPCDARILPDAHTEGVFEAAASRVSVLEGATPYLRPPIRGRVIRLFQDAHRFFADPSANKKFLKQQGIDYVALVKLGGFGYHQVIGTGDPARLGRTRFLQLVYASSAMDIYRVALPIRGSPFIRPGKAPGYRCFRTPVPA